MKLKLVNFSFKTRAQQCRLLAGGVEDQPTKDRLTAIATDYETWEANPAMALQMARRVREASKANKARRPT